MSLLVAALCAVLLNVYAVGLILARSWVYGTRLYRPMLLNVVLSFVPVIGSVAAVLGALILPLLFALAPDAVHLNAAVLWAYLGIGTILWLLFFPNAVYLITELNFSHRRDDDPVPLWYDIVHTLTLTLSGIANAVLSLSVVQVAFIVVIVDPDAGIPASSWVFAAIVIVLGAVGVYLGRYLRFNSWDVRHPASMVRKLVAHLRSPAKAIEAAGFVLTHALLLALVYVPVFVLGYGALTGA